MGWQIIKQPNDKYAIWSTIVDSFLYYNCSKQDVIDIYKKDAVKSVETQVKREIDDVDKGIIYKPFGMKFADCVNQLKNTPEKFFINVLHEMGWENE
jgi:hypothetical protein